MIFDDHSLRRQLLPLPIDWDIAEGLRFTRSYLNILARVVALVQQAQCRHAIFHWGAYGCESRSINGFGIGSSLNGLTFHSLSVFCALWDFSFCRARSHRAARSQHKSKTRRAHDQPSGLHAS